MKAKFIKGTLYLEIPTVIRIPVIYDVVRDHISTAMRLTSREGEVLDGVANSLLNKEIASKLHISERGVKFHVSSLLQKFGVQKREELRQIMMIAKSE